MDPMLAVIALARACVEAQRGAPPEEHIVCKRVADEWEGVVHEGPLGTVRGSYKDGSVLVSAGCERSAFRVTDARRVAVVRAADGAISVEEVLDARWIAQLVGIRVHLAECGELPFTVFDHPTRLFVFRARRECILFERRTLTPDVDGALALLDKQTREHVPEIRSMAPIEAAQYAHLARLLLDCRCIRGTHNGALYLFADGIYRGVWTFRVHDLLGSKMLVTCDDHPMQIDRAGQATAHRGALPVTSLRMWRGVVLWAM